MTENDQDDQDEQNRAAIEAERARIAEAVAHPAEAKTAAERRAEAEEKLLAIVARQRAAAEALDAAARKERELAELAASVIVGVIRGAPFLLGRYQAHGDPALAVLDALSELRAHPELATRHLR